MHTITFYPLGNADTCLVEVHSGQLLLFDYANTCDPYASDDRRIDLPKALRERLDAQERDDVDVLALTHLDEDHIDGVSEFFWLEHSAKYQGADRVRITELWVPAAAITETRTDLCGEGKIVQAEARHRLKRGEGIRVFSRPDALADWLRGQGLTVDSRAHLITDAGQLVPGFDAEADGVEFFVHSPFAYRQDGNLIDRNSASLVFQVTFDSAGRETRLLLSGDSPHDVLTDIVHVTKAHGNEHRLEWDVFKLPHHCSYLSLGPEKGKSETVPVPEVAWLFEEQGGEGGIVVSPSDPIPDEDTDQPPHRQAAAYYRRISRSRRGEFTVTMEHPSVLSPEPLVIDIDHLGAMLRKRFVSSAVAATRRPAPRAG